MEIHRQKEEEKETAAAAAAATTKGSQLSPSKFENATFQHHESVLL